MTSRIKHFAATYNNYIPSFHKGSISIFLLLSIVLLSAIAAIAQPAQHTENSTDQVLKGSGRINPSTLAMEFSLPLGSYPGRGINVPISLSYSSKVWRADFVTRQPRVNNPSDCISVNIPKFAENTAAGWTTSLAAPYVEYVGWDNIFNADGYPWGPDCESTTSPPSNTDNAIIKRIILHLPSGDTHELRINETPATFSGSSLPSKNGTYYAVDSSNIRYVEDSSNGIYKVQMPDGSFYTLKSSSQSYGQATVRLAERYTDRNGNYNTFNDSTGVWTDTLGRSLSAPIGMSAPGSAGTVTYTMPGLTSGSSIQYKLYWKLLKDTTAGASGLTNFSDSLKYTADRSSTSPSGTPRSSGFLFSSKDSAWIHDGGAGVFNPIVLTAVELPNGLKYEFSYDIYGRMDRIHYPTGGEERFTYDVIQPLTPSDSTDNVTDQMNFGVIERKVYPVSGGSSSYDWTYSVDYAGGAGYKISTVNPDSTRSERYLWNGSSSDILYGFSNVLSGMECEQRGFDSAGHLLSRHLTHWVSSSKERNPRVDHEEAIVYEASGNGLSSTTKFEYEGDLTDRTTPVLVNKTTTYAFVTKTDGGSFAANASPSTSPTPVPTSTPPTVTRISEVTYLQNDSNYSATKSNYTDQNMFGLVTISKVKDASGTVVSQSETVYDESGRSPGYRGNPTTGKVWDSAKGVVTSSGNFVSTHAKFDSYGNQYEVTDALGSTTTTTFDSTYNAFPITVTSAVPDSTGTHGSSSAFTTSATFDVNTGLPLTSTDLNGLKKSIEYDQTTLRPRYVKTYDGSTEIGGTAETIYHDEAGNCWVKSKSQIDDSHYAEAISYFDGLGRAFRSEEVNSAGNILVDKEFDSDGRVLRVSNPYHSGDTKIWTTNVYDTASRVVEVDLPDTSKVYTDYGVSISGTVGVTKTITDQAGKKRKGYSDALGNMIRVVEDPSGAALATDYVFDTLGNLRKTTQGDQNRYFYHSSLNRLLYARQVEQDANSNFSGSGYTDPVTSNNQWSVKYVYNDNGSITSTTDAKNVTVTASYDNLNRLYYRDYSDSTPDVSFYYDGTGLGGSAPAYSNGKTTKITSSASETKYMSFDIFGRLLTHRQTTDGNDYDTGYTYNLGGALIEETYPSGRVVKNTFDQNGDLAQVQSKKNSSSGYWTYVDALSYDLAGGIKKMQLGNGLWENFSYNDRHQITKIGLGTTDTAQDLLKLEYNYDSTSTSHDNNGSMREQKITVPTVGGTSGFTATQTYLYDDLNRLLSAEEKVSSSTAWKQTFSYDRYGNRRFDTSTSGLTTTLGSCTSAVCNPTISTSTNRISQSGYTFDANGSMTANAVGERFGYDAENHQKEFFLSTNSGSTPDATYVYDGSGVRVKKISSTETTIFVYDGVGQLVAEYSTALASTPQVSYLTQDHLGSPRVITNENGVVTSRKDFTAFGEETATAQRVSNNGYVTPATREDYTGYEKDTESGLEFAQARYYNSTQGRYTSIDPMTASATIKNPQTFNRYSYVLNTPYKMVDPLGLISETTSACGSLCLNNGPSVDGSAFRGRDAVLNNLLSSLDANMQRSNPPPPPFIVRITKDPVSLIVNFEVQTSSGQFAYLTGAGAYMYITLTDSEGKPLVGVTYSESPLRLPGSIGTGKVIQNTSTGTTGADGMIKDMVLRSIYTSDILPEPFGTKLSGSNSTTKSAPTLKEVLDHLSTSPYRSPDRQVITVGLRDGSQYEISFDRVLTNVDKNGTLIRSETSDKLNYTLDRTEYSIKLVKPASVFQPIR